MVRTKRNNNTREFYEECIEYLPGKMTNGDRKLRQKEGYQLISKSCYFIYEYIDGMNLHQFIKRKLSYNVKSSYYFRTGIIKQPIVGVILQMIETLIHINNQNIVHGNIRPSHILILETPHTLDIKFIGFNNSVYWDCTKVKTSSHTYPNDKKHGNSKILNNDIFMAPEVTTTYPTMPFADYWSLGMTILNLIVGHKNMPTFEDIQKMIALGFPHIVILKRKQNILYKSTTTTNTLSYLSYISKRNIRLSTHPHYLNIMSLKNMDVVDGLVHKSTLKSNLRLYKMESLIDIITKNMLTFDPFQRKHPCEIKNLLLSLLK